MNSVKQFLSSMRNNLGQVKDAVEQQDKFFDLADAMKTSSPDVVQYLAQMTHPVDNVINVLASSIQGNVPSGSFVAILNLMEPDIIQEHIIKLVRNMLPLEKNTPRWEGKLTDNKTVHVIKNLELMVTRLCEISDDRTILNNDALLAWTVENSQYEVVLQLERLSLDENAMTLGSHRVDALLAAFYRYGQATDDEGIKLALNLINWFSPNAENTNKLSKKPQCDTSHTG